MVTTTLSARTSNRESGQILILTAVTMIALLGIAALSLDASFMYDKRNRLQAAADAAAKSAAVEVFRQGPHVAEVRLQGFANEAVKELGFTLGDQVGQASVVISHAPKSGPFKDDNAYVEVTVSEPTSTFFARIFGAASMTPRASATAGPRPGQVCLLTMNDLNAGDHTTLTMPSCNMVVGRDLLGTGPSIDAASIAVAGTCSNGCTSNIRKGVPPLDPLPTLLYPDPPPGPPLTNCPPTTIDTARTLSESDVSTYFCGLQFSGPSGSLTLNPGTYYINGPITALPASHVSITGSDVLIYIGKFGSLSLDVDGVTMNLTGRTTGPYKSLLFFQERTNATDAVFGKANSSYTLSGALYFYGAHVELKNTALLGFGGDCFLAVAYSIDIRTNGEIQHACKSPIDFGGSPLLTVSIAR